MAVTIKTNNQWRDLTYRYDVPVKILETQFDYLTATDDGADGFFCYRDYWYHVSDFMTVSNDSPLKGWDGYAGDSFFSGVVIKLDKDCERIKVGTYYS